MPAYSVTTLHTAVTGPASTPRLLYSRTAKE